MCERIGIALRGAIERNCVLENVSIIKSFFGSKFDLVELPSDSFSEITQLILEDKLDAAVVDAKQQPESIIDEIDWFWMSLYQDYPYDAFIFGNRFNQNTHISKIGVISHNAAMWAKQHFDNINIVFVDKGINEILSDLETTVLDACIMPYYSFEHYQHLFNFYKISVYDMQKPYWEGNLSVLFKKNNQHFLKYRWLFTKTVSFVGGGAGSADVFTIGAIKTLNNTDVCLHDSLFDHSILDYLPNYAEIIDVGKRCDHHKVRQATITELISMYARMGLKVSRLKGGDPSIFGRLAEEVDVLEKLKIPYRVIPGVSSLNIMSAKSGIILTRRNINRGFCVMSAIKHGGGIAPLTLDERKRLPLIFFMGVKVVDKISQLLVRDGMKPSTKAAMIFAAGSEDEITIRGALKDIGEKVCCIKNDLNYKELPGLFVVGDIADYSFNEWGILSGKKVLIVADEATQNILSNKICDYGGMPVVYTFYDLTAMLTKDDLLDICKSDFVVLSEARVVKCFINAFLSFSVDIREIPPVITCRQATSTALKSYGIVPNIDLVNNDIDISLIKNKKIMYLYEKSIGDDTCHYFENNALNVTSKKICKHNAATNEKLRKFDYAIFSDMEYFDEFISQWNITCLKDKKVIVGDSCIRDYLKQHNINAYYIEGFLANASTIKKILLFLNQ